MSEPLVFVVENSPMTQPYTHFTSMQEFLDGSGGLGALNSLMYMFPIWNKIFLVQEVATPFTWGWAIKVLLGCKFWVVIMQWEEDGKYFSCSSGCLTKRSAAVCLNCSKVNGKPLPQVVPRPDSWGENKMKCSKNALLTPRHLQTSVAFESSFCVAYLFPLGSNWSRKV